MSFCKNVPSTESSMMLGPGEFLRRIPEVEHLWATLCAALLSQ